MSPEQITPTEPKRDDSPREEVKEFSLNIPLAKSFVYSNVAAFSVSMMDIRISFGEAMPDQSVESRVGIVLPPENAAYMALLLMEQVHIYERNFGPIRLELWQESKKKALANRKAAGTPAPAPETEPIQRHIKPNRQRENSETPATGTTTTPNPDERMEIG